MTPRETLLADLRRACPAFGPACDAFVAAYADTPGGLPLYILMGDLIPVCSTLQRDGRGAELAPVFALIEGWLTGGDDYTRTLAVTGFLEDLQNGALHRGTRPDDFHPMLGARAREAWDQLNGFWSIPWKPGPQR